MTRKLLTAVMCGFVALTAVGCGPSVKKIVAEHRSDAEAKLAQLDNILSDCRKRPVSAEQRLPMPSGVRLQPATTAGPSGNVRVVWLQAFDRGTDLIPKDGSGYSSEPGLWWDAPKRALAGNWKVENRDEAEQLKKHFQALRDVEYVLVINTPTIEAPRHDHDDWYRMGSAQGCIQLYRMADGQYIGGAEFEGGTELLGVGAMDFSLSSKDPAMNVENLRGRMYRDLHTQAGKRLMHLPKTSVR